MSRKINIIRTCAVLLLIAALSISLGCEKPKSNPLEPPEASDNITHKVGEEFVISLASNQTTGYSWRLGEPKPDILELVGNKYIPDKNPAGLVGAGGTEQWTFKAIRKGKCTINLEYVRPWEKDVPPVDKWTITVTVK